MNRFRHIVVEGPIGVGKTSLARRLSDHLGYELHLENAGDNPFLPRFYREPKRYALPTQLHFLFDRARQLRDDTQGDLFVSGSVSDYLLEKDPLFARLNLDDDEFSLYLKVFSDLVPQTPAPDLVIYLQAPTEQLQGRVRQRGIDYEQGMDADYLTRLSAAYSDFFHRYDAAPLLIVNTEHLDLTRDEHFALLLERVAKLRGAREFFSLAA